MNSFIKDFIDYVQSKIKDKESAQKYLIELGINNYDGSLTEKYGGKKTDKVDK